MDTLSHRIQSALSHLLHRGGQLPAQRPTVAVDRTVLTLHGEGGAAWSGEGQVGRWRLRTARAIRDGEARSGARRLVVSGPGLGDLTLCVERDAVVHQDGDLRTGDPDFDRHARLIAPAGGAPRLLAALGPGARAELRALSRLGSVEVRDGQVILHREHRAGADDSVRIACIHLGRLVRVATRLAAGLADAPARLAARVRDEQTPALRLTALEALALGWPDSGEHRAARRAAAMDRAATVRRGAALPRPTAALALPLAVVRRPHRTAVHAA